MARYKNKLEPRFALYHEDLSFVWGPAHWSLLADPCDNLTVSRQKLATRNLTITNLISTPLVFVYLGTASVACLIGIQAAIKSHSIHRFMQFFQSLHRGILFLNVRSDTPGKEPLLAGNRSENRHFNKRI